MKRALIIIVCALGLSQSVKSQGSSDFQLSINYNIGVPTGEFADFISRGSFRGMNLQLDYYLSDKLSIGGYIGWNGFYQKKDRESYYFENNGVNGAINGVRYNYLYQLPLYLKVQYILIDNGAFNPYIGLAVGGHYIEHETYIGYVGFASQDWRFGLAPEVGTYMMMGQSGWSFKFAAAYHMTFYNKNDIATIQNLGINLGFNYDF